MVLITGGILMIVCLILITINGKIIHFSQTIDHVCSKFLVTGMLLIFLVGTLSILICRLPLSTLSDCYLASTHPQTKVTERHDLYSVKTDDSHYICLQETTKNKYISKKYNTTDVTVFEEKGITPHIDTIQESFDVGTWFVILTTRTYTKYRLYIPLTEKSTFDLKGKS